MCLPKFIEFKDINESEPITGYRTWRNKISPVNNDLISEHQDYIWKSQLEGPHEVLEKNSGIYAYNNNNYYNNYNYYNNNYYNYNNYNNNNYNNYNNNYYYNYYISGIIKQHGKVAIHKDGYRSEYAKIETIFNIRESDMKGTIEFTNWIKKFNTHINNIAEKYECSVISWQDFKELHNKG